MGIMFRLIRKLSVLCCLGASVYASSSSTEAVGPSTVTVENLGNPYLARYPSGEAVYARNIWDICAYRGRLFLGAGNSSNWGPAVNAGPVPVFSYDPLQGIFREEFIVDDEQVDVLHVFGDQLYIPGHDPRESWDLGNFYRLDITGSWHKYRNIPEGIHNYDMAYWGNTLFAGLCTRWGGAVGISRDMGLTWQNVSVSTFRIYALVTLKDRLYAVGMLPDVFVYDEKGGFIPVKGITKRVMFPGVNLQKGLLTRIARPISADTLAFFIGAYCHNDHQYRPFGLFVARSLQQGAPDIRRVILPPQGRPWDLLSYDGEFYVLLDYPSTEYTTVKVMHTKDGTTWRELLQFRSSTFARSFAVLNGDWYFGLGCEVQDAEKWRTEELNAETGTVLRVRSAQLK
jgi:hypothetical protein